MTDPAAVPHSEPVPPMLQMDGIRIATLITLGAHTVAVIVLWVYLMTNVAQQRQANECYQDQADLIVSAIIAGRQAAADPSADGRGEGNETVMSSSPLREEPTENPARA